MSTAQRIEAYATGAALVRSVQEHDAEAGRVVMDGADHEAVCQALAKILTGVFRAAAGGSDDRAGLFVDVWQDEVRRALAASAEEGQQP
jgi:hypothetical protein